MKNNSQIGIFLLVFCTSLSAVFTQILLVTATPLSNQDNINSTTLLARVVHDPDDGKAPPPS
jgi:hypothetical protein